MSELLKRYEAHRIERPGTGCHASLLGKANLGRMAGLTQDAVFADIRASIPSGGRKVPDGEIKDAITKAWNECDPLTQAMTGRGYKPRVQPATPPPFNGAKYRAELIRRSAGAGEVDLWEASPYRIDWTPGPEDAAMVLRLLYRPTETIYLGDQYGKSVKTVQRHLERIEAGKVPPHIMLNPVDGEQHTTTTGTMSRRCDAAVCEYRFAIVEFDEMPLPDQIAFWLSIIAGDLLPVAALVHSGGKSIHAWLRVNLPDVDAWNKVVRHGLYDAQVGRMAILGADKACSNPARLSRLPGHFRRERGQWQKLLYFNPYGGAS